MLPLYVGVAVMASAAAAGLTLTIDEPAFAIFLHGMIVAGVLLSYLGSLRSFSPGLLGALVAAVATPAASLRRPDLPVIGLFYPPEVCPEDDLVLATLAAWGLVAFCFALANRSYIVFAFACGLTVFGLTGTLNVNPPFLAAYFVFVVAGIFVWSYDTLLSQYDRALAAGAAPLSAPRRWAQSYLGLTVLQGAVVLVLALALGYPLYQISPFFYGQGQRSWLRHHALPASDSTFADFQGAFALGNGPVNLGTSPVLRVKANRPELWRAAVYHQYDGRGWRAGGMGLPLWPRSDRFGPYAPRQDRLDERPWLAGRPRLEQDVELLRPLGYALVAAAEPVEITYTPREAGEASIDDYGCVRLTSIARPGLRYSIVSAVPDPSAAELRRVGAEYPDDIREHYINEVPVSTRVALEELVQGITAGADNAYDKILAIEAYLYEHGRYSLEEPPVPRDRDVVVYFVQDHRAGACDMFASALAMMGRLAGVPTRVATGYATGEDVVAEDGRAAFLVRQNDAHAWTEVYFPGHGWIPFDPPTQEQEPTWLDRLVRSGGLYLGASRLWRRAVWVVVAVAAVYLMLTGAFGLRGISSWLSRPSPSSRRSLARVSRSYDRLCRTLGRRGWPRHPWQTPLEHAAGVAAPDRGSAAVRGLRRGEEGPCWGVATAPAGPPGDLPGSPGDAQQAVREMAELFCRLRYSPREPTPEEADAFAARAAALARELRRRRRS